MSYTLSTLVVVLYPRWASNVVVQRFPKIAVPEPSASLASWPLCALYVRRNARSMPRSGTFTSSACNRKFPVPTFTKARPMPGTFSSSYVHHGLIPVVVVTLDVGTGVAVAPGVGVAVGFGVGVGVGVGVG